MLVMGKAEHDLGKCLSRIVVKIKMNSLTGENRICVSKEEERKPKSHQIDIDWIIVKKE